MTRPGGAGSRGWRLLQEAQEGPGRQGVKTAAHEMVYWRPTTRWRLKAQKCKPPDDDLLRKTRVLEPESVTLRDPTRTLVSRRPRPVSIKVRPGGGLGAEKE